MTNITAPTSAMPEPGSRVQTTSPVLGDYDTYIQAKRRRIMIRQIFRGTIGVLGVLLIWEAMSRYFGIQLILPRPYTVIENTIRTLLVANNRWLYGPNIYVHLEHSFLRAMTGFVSAAVIGIPMGLLLGRSTSIREFIMPLVKAVYPVPGIAWIPLSILWFGLGDTAVVFVVFTTSLFPLIFTTEAGARAINPTVLNAGLCFGARGPVMFFRVIFPATVPHIVTGLRIALGTAWRMVVAGELLASQDGIGYMLMEARFQFRSADLMTAMILVSIVGFLTEKLIVDTIEKRTVEKWEVQPT